MEQAKRNIGLDYFKIVLSILVVTIHLYPLFEMGSFSSWVVSNGISRIAVPCFFVITGYYIPSRLSDKSAMKKYLLHLLLVYCVWTIVYLPVFLDTTNTDSILLGLSMGYFHLWFFPALIAGILLLVIAEKYIKNDILIVTLALALFVFGYFLNMEPYIIYYSRNGLTIAFPFIVLGYYSKKLMDKNQIKASHLLISVVIGLLALLGESYWKYIYTGGLGLNQDFFFSMLLFCPALVLLFQKYPFYRPSKSFLSYLYIGIFLLHPLVLHIVKITPTYTIYRLPVVLVFTLIFAYLVYLVNKNVRIFY